MGVQDSYHLHDRILNHLEDKLPVMPGRDFYMIGTEEGGLTLLMGGTIPWDEAQFGMKRGKQAQHQHPPVSLCFLSANAT